MLEKWKRDITNADLIIAIFMYIFETYNTINHNVILVR